jgi:hypothetical protein
MLLPLFLACCGRLVDEEIPGVVCGTRVNPDLVRSMVESADGWHEYDRVDRAVAITAPCLVLVSHDVILRFRFSWRETATDLMYLARDTGPISGIADPRRIESAYETIIGMDGAISTAPCKTNGGNYFTLTLQLPQVRQQDRTHRKDIERFMRAYFPATLKTLGCGKDGQRQKTS